MIGFILFPVILLSIVLILFVFIPMKTINGYKAKGYATFFYPILGSLANGIKDLKTRGDQFASSKEFSKNFPDQKLQISNVGTKTIVSLTDPQYIKEFLLKPHLYEKSGVTKFIAPLVGGSGLVMSEGETWKRHRKIISSSSIMNLLRQIFLPSEIRRLNS